MSTESGLSATVRALVCIHMLESCQIINLVPNRKAIQSSAELTMGHQDDQGHVSSKAEVYDISTKLVFIVQLSSFHKRIFSAHVIMVVLS